MSSQIFIWSQWKLTKVSFIRKSLTRNCFKKELQKNHHSRLLCNLYKTKSCEPFSINTHESNTKIKRDAYISYFLFLCILKSQSFALTAYICAQLWKTTRHWISTPLRCCTVNIERQKQQQAPFGVGCRRWFFILLGCNVAHVVEMGNRYFVR